MRIKLLAGLLICMGMAQFGCGITGSQGLVGVRAEVGYLQPVLDGNFHADIPGVAGTSIDLQTTTGTEDTADAVFAAVAVELGPLAVHLDGWQGSFGGTALATSTFVFNGLTYTAGNTVITDLDMTNVGLTVDFSIIPLPIITVAIGLGVDAYDVQLNIQEPSSGNNTSLDEMGVIPSVAVRVEVTPPLIDFIVPMQLTVFANARGMSIDTDIIGAAAGSVQGNATFVDLWIGVRATWELVTASLGYKYTSLDANIMDAGGVDITIQGIVFTVGAQF